MEALILLVILPFVYLIECYVVYWLVLLLTYSATLKVRKIALVVLAYPGVVGNAYSMLPIPLVGWGVSLLFPSAKFVWIPLPFIFQPGALLNSIIFVAVELAVLGMWIWLVRRWFIKLENKAANNAINPDS